MYTLLRAVVVFAVFGPCLAEVRLGAQQDASSSDDDARDSVVVLKNGSILTGAVTRAGDFLLIVVGQSDEIRMPVAQVEFFCGSLEEAYFLKRDRLRGDDVRQRLELARWCLQHQLIARAADQYLAAQIVDRRHPGVKALDRRLSFASMPSPAPRRSARQSSQATQEQLERMLDETDSDTVEEFTGFVQPMLLNRCASGACHGRPTSLTFRLFRPLPGKTLPRRLTQQNLFATLAQIDQSSPDASPLLTTPFRPHGGTETPVFDATEESMYHKLLSWLNKASDGPAEDESMDMPRVKGPRSIGIPGKALLQTTDRAMGRAPVNALETSQKAPAGAPNRTTPIGPEAQRGESRPSVSGPVAKDPFDPGVFNRRNARRPAAGQQR